MSKQLFLQAFSDSFFLLCNIRRSLSVSSPFLTFLAHFTKRKYEVHAYIMRNTYTSSTKTKWNCKWSQFHEIFKYQSDFLKKLPFLIYVECHTYNRFNLMWDIPMSTGQINEGVVHKQQIKTSSYDLANCNLWGFMIVLHSLIRKYFWLLFHRNYNYRHLEVQLQACAGNFTMPQSI